MNGTWEWLVEIAGWVFLVGTAMVLLSAVPRVAERRPRLMLEGFLVAIASFGLVFLAWALPRLLP